MSAHLVITLHHHSMIMSWRLSRVKGLFRHHSNAPFNWSIIDLASGSGMSDAWNVVVIHAVYSHMHGQICIIYSVYTLARCSTTDSGKVASIGISAVARRRCHLHCHVFICVDWLTSNARQCILIFTWLLRIDVSHISQFSHRVRNYTDVYQTLTVVSLTLYICIRCFTLLIRVITSRDFSFGTVVSVDICTCCRLRSGQYIVVIVVQHEHEFHKNEGVCIVTLCGNIQSSTCERWLFTYWWTYR